MARETAHQLGTPVSALMGWVDWLKDHPEKSNEILSEIELDLQRLEQISRRFSNMGSKPHFSEFDLSIKVEKIVEYLNKRLPSLGKKVELLNDIDPDIKINGNGSLLAWAIENIIRNGIDAIERDDGQISISLKQANNIVKIQIHDNGIGIQKKDWKNIFRPGFSTKKTGWGLGLSLSKRIVEDIHNGSLSIASSSMKKGTIIQISL
jgi:signal transduction histidine kinase